MVKIGFANLDERSEYAIQVREGLQIAASELPDVELLTFDNELNDEKALENVQRMVDENVDVAIIFHINERLAGKFRALLNVIPIIGVDTSVPLAPYVGIDNRQMGLLAGEALADWLNSEWQGNCDKLIGLIDHRVLDSVRARITAAVEVVHERCPALNKHVFYVDCGNTRSGASSIVQETLQEWVDNLRVAIISFNEESAFGTQDAIRKLGRSDRCIVVGHAASDDLVQELKNPETLIIASTVTYPDAYGAMIMDAALKLASHERVAGKNFVPLDLLKKSS